ncbi:alpha/beta hydrolase [Rhodococcoides corynebacterioides]|uniref:alpha/beta hydrolase n=1 Tax=Rhodococcoides corynebacterioides TaxID=53972 RepID=UPI003F7F0534
MALDEHASALISELQQQGLPPFHQMTPEQVRETIDTFTGLQLPAEPVGNVINTHYTSDGHELAINLYIPEQAEQPRPVVLYFHGGGFIAGSLTVVDEPARALANATGALVATAEYRLAPEHKFPAAPDDAWAALNWVDENIDHYGGDAGQIIVMGDSAGGNLAAVTALRARDSNGPRISGQILLYPALDPNARFASRDEFSEGYLIGAADMDFFWGNYLASAGDADNPAAVPSRAHSLRGLPPTLIATTENEVLRDEGEDYGRRLRDAGVDARVIRFDGLLHGAFWMSGALPRSEEMREAVNGFVTTICSSSPAL